MNAEENLLLPPFTVMRPIICVAVLPSPRTYTIFPSNT